MHTGRRAAAAAAIIIGILLAGTACTRDIGNVYPGTESCATEELAAWTETESTEKARETVTQCTRADAEHDTAAAAGDAQGLTGEDEGTEADTEAETETNTETDAEDAEDAEDDGDAADTEEAEQETGTAEQAEAGTETEVKAPEYTYTEASGTMYATVDLNVRSGPSVAFAVTGALEKGESVTVTARCSETGWYRISYGSGSSQGDALCVGYASGKYLSVDAPEKDTEETSGTEKETDAADAETAPEEKPDTDDGDGGSGTGGTPGEDNGTETAGTENETEPAGKEDPESTGPQKEAEEAAEPETEQPEKTGESEKASGSSGDTEWLFSTEGDIEDSVKKYIQDQLKRLPSSMLDDIADTGWEIIATDADLSAYTSDLHPEGGEIYGVTIYAPKKIYVAGRLLYDADGFGVYNPVIHEVGHWIDWRIAQDGGGWPSRTEEAEALWESSAEAFRAQFGVYSTYSCVEFFAKCIQAYYTRNAKFREACPEYAGWLDGLLSRWE